MLVKNICLAIYPDRVYNEFSESLHSYGVNYKNFKGGQKMEENNHSESPLAEQTEEAANEASCCAKTKERSDQEYKDLIHRLNRVEGQIRGIRGMVERDAYCIDILVQVAAANAALNSFGKVLLANHIKTCVTQDIREGKEETVDELVSILQRFMR
jgi:DNA-binding FrmR family transcriptional regulator